MFPSFSQDFDKIARGKLLVFNQDIQRTPSLSVCLELISSQRKLGSMVLTLIILWNITKISLYKNT